MVKSRLTVSVARTELMAAGGLYARLVRIQAESLAGASVAWRAAEAGGPNGGRGHPKDGPHGRPSRRHSANDGER